MSDSYSVQVVCRMREPRCDPLASELREMTIVLLLTALVVYALIVAYRRTSKTEINNAEQEPIEFYRCTECGKTSVSIGWLHAHIESHRGLFGLQWPWRVGDYEALMEMTEVIQVSDYDVVEEPEHV